MELRSAGCAAVFARVFFQRERIKYYVCEAKPLHGVSAREQRRGAREGVYKQGGCRPNAKRVERDTIMKGTAASPQPTDGGVVLTLFLCVAAITYAMFSAIKLFVGAKYPKERNERRLVRLLSGSANFGNGIVHALLIAVLYANRNSSINFYVKELEEGYAGTRARSAQHANGLLFELCGVTEISHNLCLQARSS